MTSSRHPTTPELLGVLVKETQATLHQKMSEKLRPLGLTVPQYACLQALYDRPEITGSELARQVFVSRQSMNVLLQGMEKRGLIERSNKPGPRRERATTLTNHAVSLARESRTAVAEVATTMTADLTVQQQSTLESLLRTCCDALRSAP